MARLKAQQNTSTHCSSHERLARVSWTPPTRRCPQGGSSLPLPLTLSRQGDEVWLARDGSTGRAGKAGNSGNSERIWMENLRHKSLP